jgi:hypothetical protein
MQRPSSGRASDDFMRKEIDNITRMQLHVNNVPRYFEALDAWVRSVSTLTLKDITTILQEKLSDSL